MNQVWQFWGEHPRCGNAHLSQFIVLRADFQISMARLIQQFQSLSAWQLSQIHDKRAIELKALQNHVVTL